MKCYNCGRGIDDGVEEMLPIDPKGAPDRRWACIDCAKELAVMKIAKEIVDFSKEQNHEEKQ